MRGPGGKSRRARAMADEAALCAAFAGLTSASEARAFLRDIATPAEIEAFSERWAIARLLAEDRLSYREIAGEVGASTTTVGRVARFLRDETFGGYRAALERLAPRGRDKRKSGS